MRFFFLKLVGHHRSVETEDNTNNFNSTKNALNASVNKVSPRCHSKPGTGIQVTMDTQLKMAGGTNQQHSDDGRQNKTKNNNILIVTVQRNPFTVE